VKHKQAMLFFYGMSFSFIVLQAVLFLLTTIFGAMVTKTGWEGANKLLLVVLFTLAGCTVFCFAIPEALDFDGNIESNKNFFNSHLRLITEVTGYLGTMENMKGDFIDPANFSHYVSRESVRLQAVSVQFNEQSIRESLKQIQESY